MIIGIIGGGASGMAAAIAAAGNPQVQSFTKVSQHWLLRMCRWQESVGPLSLRKMSTLLIIMSILGADTFD